MDFTITVQPTPNPNALKFVLNVPLKSTDTAVFKTAADAKDVPLAGGILNISHVTEVYFSGKFLTVTQDGTADWDDLEAKIKNIIQGGIAGHNPDFALSASGSGAAPLLTGELAKISVILNSTIRPALQRDGGDLEIISLEGDVLTISYQGACGCCPHAAMGTLYAIQNILQDQYRPGIQVQMA